MRRFLLTVAICAAMAGVACNAIPGKPADDQAAIRTALQSYLSQRGNLNMAGMDMEVQVARNDGKTADVNVNFRAKQGGGSMQMAYQLEKQGGLWVVKGSKSPMGGGSHPDVGAGAASPAPSQTPPAHPPIRFPQPGPAKRP